MPELEPQLNLDKLLERREKGNNRWAVVDEFPENMTLGPNLRDINDEHVFRIAESIVELGQMQECVGDTLSDGRIRVWAGQHRFLAVLLINNTLRENGLEGLHLRVRVYPSEMTPHQVFSVQLAENLHNEMSPEEEAEAIETLWGYYRRLFPDDKASIAGMARLIGRGESKVRNALKFMELDSKVRELVERGGLMYSVAVELARLPQERQLEVAMKIVLYNLERGKAEKIIREVLGEGQMPSLFSQQEEEAMKGPNHRLAFRKAADRAARDADGYFKRVWALIRVLEDGDTLKVTNPVRDILAGFIQSGDNFRTLICDKAPELSRVLLGKAEITDLPLTQTPS